jgi:hypothetical protein
LIKTKIVAKIFLLRVSTWILIHLGDECSHLSKWADRSKMPWTAYFLRKAAIFLCNGGLRLCAIWEKEEKKYREGF